jgi:hypothetical protein
MLLLAACQPVRPISELTPAPVETLRFSPIEQAMADASLAFVAAQTPLAPELLRVESIEAVEWPDAGLGCPQPEMIYAAVVTSGFRVIVVTETEQFTVHTDSRSDGEKIICTQE